MNNALTMKETLQSLGKLYKAKRKNIDHMLLYLLAWCIFQTMSFYQCSNVLCLRSRRQGVNLHEHEAYFITCHVPKGCCCLEDYSLFEKSEKQIENLELERPYCFYFSSSLTMTSSPPRVKYKLLLHLTRNWIPCSNFILDEKKHNITYKKQFKGQIICFRRSSNSILPT